jgi:Cys-tRNA(Pro)/Cys-tRNA(Cys) deacylase
VATKSNAARALDKLGIAYELRAYRSDPDDLSPERLEREIGLPRAAIYKTLAVRGGEGGALFAVIATAAELDLKLLARAAKQKRVELLSRAELQAMTGYVRGAVTALASKKTLPVFIDAACESLPQLGVSAGVLGLELVLSPADYVRATRATVAAIIQREPA